MKYRTGKTLLCETCRSEYWLTDLELSFYAGEGISSPTKCRSCKRKEGIEQGRRYHELQPTIIPIRPTPSKQIY